MRSLTIIAAVAAIHLNWVDAFTPSVLVPSSSSSSCSRHHSAPNNDHLGTTSTSNSNDNDSNPALSNTNTKLHSTTTTSAETSGSGGATSPSMHIVEQFLSTYEQSLKEGHQWAEEFGFFPESDGEDAEQTSPTPEGAFYAIFRAIREIDSNNNNNGVGGRSDDDQEKKLLGLSGTPFYIPASLLAKAEENNDDDESTTTTTNHKNLFSDFFHFPHLATALEEDFLDATRGSTDNRKGWQVAAVSQPTGSSFDDARMTLDQVKTALESGTVIFNNIGAHIPRLAGPTLASTDAMSLPGALNMYVTARGMRTSAPPHTDRQDVLVVQMEGAKRWRVFTPPTDGDVKPTADPFARGKGEDSLPLHILLEEKEGRLGTELLLDVVLREGDVLYIPAGFPHTTDTVEETTEENAADYDTSIHLTFNIDTHVWDLDHLGVRNAALKRSGLKDVLAPPSFSATNAEVNRYTGRVNQLSPKLRSELMDALPLEFLDGAAPDNNSNPDIIANLERLCSMVNEETGDDSATLSADSLKEALERIHAYGSTILDIHRDMYLAAVEEGRTREVEAAMIAHIKDSSSKKVKMSQERIQRLSLFRVRPFFEKIGEVKKELEQWCLSGSVLVSNNVAGDNASASGLDPNWQFTTPLKVGDECEADLGGAFFAAKIAKVSGSTYEVAFFDGDREWLERDQIKLLNPPAASDDGLDGIDTTEMTKKEIKKLKKKMEKKMRK